MSNEKSTPKQFTQEAHPQAQPADMLDCQYKSIGISALSAACAAAKGPKVKAPTEQWN
ncbi:hypothetical protein [Siculibacillus lacustris]|uniref:hypothetical protein n=1 Tax=Siculibacillus lacustris TaxID=1549641 RepID=UPI0013F1748F|nr:hypothetical protein [Siculibacillus lacustris]